MKVPGIGRESCDSWVAGVAGAALRGGSRSEDHEVVAVDDLALVRRPKGTGQVPRRASEQPGQLADA